MIPGTFLQSSGASFFHVLLCYRGEVRAEASDKSERTDGTV